jgi:Bax protein
MKKLVFANVSYFLRIGVLLTILIISAILFYTVNNLGIKNLEAKKREKPEVREAKKIVLPKERERKKKRRMEIDEIRIRVIKPIYLSSKNPNEIFEVSNCNNVLPIVYTKPINFKIRDIKLKKRKFISYMLPQVLMVNFEIEEQRKVVEKIKEKLAKGKSLTKAEEKFLNNLMGYYRAKSIDTLIKRLHVNPPSLVIAQAIAESGWGTSRFYLEGANAFGITAIRGKGKTIKMYGQNIYMRKYDNVVDSIRDYYYSINVSWAFEKLRKVRLSTSDPIEISHYLDYYSTLRDIYIRRIQGLITANKLRKLDKCKISPIYMQEIPLSQYLKIKKFHK